MNNKAFTMSLIMAILAVVMVQSYVEGMKTENELKYGTPVFVMKAKTDIREMETITDAHFEVAPIPIKFLEPSAISFPETTLTREAESKEMKKYTGWVAIVPIKKGEQITLNKVTEPGVRTGLSPQVAPGKRAVSILATDTTSVGKLIKPGDRVDVMAVIDMGGSPLNKVVRTVLQDVVVLAVGRNVTNNAARTVEIDTVSGKDKIRSLAEDTSFSTVTLEVEPPQAQSLALIAAGGNNVIMLSLRNNDDQEQKPINAMGMQEVLNQQRGLAGKP